MRDLEMIVWVLISRLTYILTKKKKNIKRPPKLSFSDRKMGENINMYKHATGVLQMQIDSRNFKK